MIEINESLFIGILIGAMIAVLLTTTILFLYSLLSQKIRTSIRDHEYECHTEKYFGKKVKK